MKRIATWSLLWSVTASTSTADAPHWFHVFSQTLSGWVFSRLHVFGVDIP